MMDFKTRQVRRSVRINLKKETATAEQMKGKSYNCSECRGYSAKCVESLKNHIHYTNNPKFACDVCRKHFNSSRSLNVHTRVHTLQCDRCDKAFSQNAILAEHRIQAHRVGKLVDYTCTQCDKVFTSKRGVDRHMTTHTKGNPYLCDICGKAFSFRPNFLIHIKLHTENKTFLCQYCGRHFPAAYLLQHEKTHLKPEKVVVKCLDCGAAPFNETCRLSRHRRYNTSGKKKFKCSQCDYSAFSRHSVRHHFALVHEKRLLHKCDVCKKPFMSKAYLKTHMLLHTGDKPFKCSDCGKWFKWRSSLNEHKCASSINTTTPSQARSGAKVKESFLIDVNTQQPDN